MGAWLDLIAASPTPRLWLDDTAYTSRLLAGARAPWLDAAEVVAWRRKAQALLQPDVIELDVSALVSAWIEARAPLRASMAAKRRMTAPLRTLLADEALRQHVAEILLGLRGSNAGPIALRIPSPPHWIAQAYEAAFGTSAKPGEDEAESASLYVADFLRAFSEAGLDVLLLDEIPAATLATPGQASWRQSVINIARHYRWDVGLRADCDIDCDQSDLDFLIAPKGMRAMEVSTSFWETGNVPSIATGSFWFASIPEDAQPELVLERLAALRSMY